MKSPPARCAYTWRRFGWSFAAAVFCALMGFGVREAESSQVGYTHDASLWIFGASGLFAYYALIVLWTLLRARRRKARDARMTERIRDP